MIKKLNCSHEALPLFLIFSFADDYAESSIPTKFYKKNQSNQFMFHMPY